MTRGLFSSVIAGMIFMCMPLVSVAGDDIPYNPAFPKAQYPYAQAPDGCSGLSDPEQIRDTWGPVNFEPACNKHDRCYYTYGSSWQRCNEEFLKDLVEACWNDLRICVTPDFCLPPEPVSLAACTAIAVSYYGVVQAAVAFDVFSEAQTLQKRYDEWVARFYCLSGPIYVNSDHIGNERGTLAQPFKSIHTAYDKACVRAEINIFPGIFSGRYEFNRPIILNAQNGIVVIGD
jgi:hypothetical protein